MPEPETTSLGKRQCSFETLSEYCDKLEARVEELEALPNDDPVLLGTWVRFYRDNQLVIGEVQYTYTSVRGTMILCTDRGEVPEDSVLESRGKPDAE